MNDLDAQRIRNVEERLSKLEQKVNGLSAPILDAIENFRRDTLNPFEGFASRIVSDVAKRLDESDARSAQRSEEADARNAKRFEEVLAAIKKPGQ